jgi:hypothetical protein
MNEVYLDDLAEKTHRGLEGQARAGNSAGGHACGYRHVPIEDAERRDAFGRLWWRYGERSSRRRRR